MHKNANMQSTNVKQMLASKRLHQSRITRMSSRTYWPRRVARRWSTKYLPPPETRERERSPTKCARYSGTRITGSHLSARHPPYFAEARVFCHSHHQKHFRARLCQRHTLLVYTSPAHSQSHTNTQTHIAGLPPFSLPSHRPNMWQPKQARQTHRCHALFVAAKLPIWMRECDTVPHSWKASKCVWSKVV